MDKYFGRHWPDEPFRLLDASHLWLLATLVVVVTVALIWDDAPPTLPGAASGSHWR